MVTSIFRKTFLSLPSAVATEIDRCSQIQLLERAKKRRRFHDRDIVTHSECQVQSHQHDSWKRIGVTNKCPRMMRHAACMVDIPGRFSKDTDRDIMPNPRIQSQESGEPQSRRCQHSNEGEWKDQKRTQKPCEGTRKRPFYRKCGI